MDTLGAGHLSVAEKDIDVPISEVGSLQERGVVYINCCVYVHTRVAPLY